VVRYDPREKKYEPTYGIPIFGNRASGCEGHSERLKGSGNNFDVESCLSLCGGGISATESLTIHSVVDLRAELSSWAERGKRDTSCTDTSRMNCGIATAQHSACRSVHNHSNMTAWPLYVTSAAGNQAQVHHFVILFLFCPSHGGIGPRHSDRVSCAAKGFSREVQTVKQTTEAETRWDR
jgi:hypothetical protein